MKIKLNKRIMKFFGFKHEKHYMSATEAKNIFMYGFKNVGLQDALSSEISELETAIKSKSGLGVRVITRTLPDYKQDLAEKLKEHFIERGFVVDIYTNQKIEGFVILIIGW